MAISGYTSTTSAAPGGSVDFHLSAERAGTARLVVERIGRAGGTLDVSVAVGVHAHPPPTTLAHSWPVAYTLNVPRDWATGLYVLKARGPGDTALEDVAEFVVRASAPGATSRVLLATDLITPQAYNDVGGRSRSLYTLPRANKVSFNRPTRPDPGRGSVFFIPWLESAGYAVEHASMVDLHVNSRLLDNYDCLIFVHHVEYWSREMRDQVERFIRNGGNVISLSGNTCYRQVRFENSNRTLVGYKIAAADPASDLYTTSVAFTQPPVHRPPNHLLGAGFTYGAWRGAELARYRLHFPSHWALAGVGVSHETIPFMWYETDAAPFAMEDEGYPRVTGEEGTPLSTVVLASADLGRWTGKPGMATATLYVRHGMVFSAGTTEWVYQLGDAAIGRITRNVIDRLRTRRRFEWERVGHVNAPVALAALENRLWVATNANRLWRRHPVLADANWREIGHANAVVAMAADRGTLFCVASGNVLYWRAPADADIAWTPIGTGPAGGTRAMAASGGVLYAVANDGTLWSRSAKRADEPWQAAGGPPPRTDIVAMTSYHGILIAATSGNRLLRTGFDFVRESVAWVDIGACFGARGLAVVDNMLFCATASAGLYWLDMHHAALDALSTET